LQPFHSRSFAPIGHASKHTVHMGKKMIYGFSISLILINLASIMERADENLLPAVYKEVSAAFDAGPTDLGYLTFIMNFLKSIASPLAGVLALQYDRPTILAVGTVFWALSTGAVGVSQYFQQVAFWRGVNGVGLAIVIPSLQSFIADSYREGTRGAGFGLLSLIGSIGGIGGSIVATVMAGRDYWGFPGWRFAFIVVAFASLLIGLLVYFYTVDPRKTSPGNLGDDDTHERSRLVGNSVFPPLSIWKDSWITARSVMKVRTFQIIVLQGIVGSLPWTAVVFFTMWFELIGFDNKSSAGLNSLFAIGCASGSFLGGVIADRVSRRYPDSGRIMCAQFSAFMGIPFTWILLTVIPQSVDYWYSYAVTLFLMGLTISWCATCANNPMFAEVVPPKHRTMIYAFDRAFEGSFSSLAAPAVGMVTEKVYGYNSKTVNLADGSVAGAYALSRGLLTMMIVPFGLCCLFYTPLYFVFKRDRENARLAASTKDLELI
uniref:Major facilitator superfamily (MFS) profile domain-containing protein n=1 Tax=Aegilops tauschii subsp. strangulata TaxID=200361 RepID=A0A453M6Z9_AEGTS